jgi:phosphoribosylaminoimidazolecarboxamide formyltransferase/IMP cyclohydrolase
MTQIKRALVSVSDKAGIVDFAKALNDMGVEILSTGGTAKILKENNIPVRLVSDYTGFPEMMDGRVKTLHPKIHAALLALRDNDDHMRQVEKQKVELIDMVVVNLYPFEATVAKEGVSLDEAIENIDIGGPTMLRSAAKNGREVAVIVSPKRYDQIISEMKANDGAVPEEIKKELMVEVFEHTSKYDTAIYGYLRGNLK